MGSSLKLCVLAHGAGSVEWRVVAPAATPGTLLRALLLGLVLVAAPAACLGASWRAALLLGVAAAAALLAARALLGVQSESLTYIRLLGVRLASQRPCGLWGSSRFIPLRQLQGIIIHEEVTATSVHFWLGLTLKAEGSSVSGNSNSRSMAAHRRSSAGTGGGGRRVVADGGEVEVVFPGLRPRLSLLRQVYQQLQPLLQADLDALQEQQGEEEGEEAVDEQENGQGEQATAGGGSRRRAAGGGVAAKPRQQKQHLKLNSGVCML